MAKVMIVQQICLANSKRSLNLAISSSCDLQPIRNCLGVVEKMYCFFNTPKRKNILLEAINNGNINTKIKSLNRLCATRWVQRYDAINDFVELFPYAVTSLENIANWKNGTSIDACMVKYDMDSEFLISL